MKKVPDLCDSTVSEEAIQGSCLDTNTRRGLFWRGRVLVWMNLRDIAGMRGSHGFLVVEETHLVVEHFLYGLSRRGNDHLSSHFLHAYRSSSS